LVLSAQFVFKFGSEFGVLVLGSPFEVAVEQRQRTQNLEPNLNTNARSENGEI
jgi:hypothetical protein